MRCRATQCTATVCTVTLYAFTRRVKLSLELGAHLAPPLWPVQ